MSLSYEDNDGTPIAIYKPIKGQGERKLVFLNQIEDDNIELDDIPDDIVKSVYGSKIHSNKQLERYREILLKDLRKKDIEQRRCLSLMKRSDNKHKYFPLPPKIGEERMVWNVIGQSGSGKSYFSRELAKAYSDMGYKLFFVCPREDPTFTANEYFPCEKVNLDDFVDKIDKNEYDKQLEAYKEAKVRYRHKKKELETDAKIRLELLIEKMKPDIKMKDKGKYKITKKYLDTITSQPSLFILDDYEGFAGDELRKCEYLMKQQLILDRKNAVNMIVITHQATSGLKSRDLLNESTCFVFFSRTLGKNITYLCQKYLALPLQFRRRITDMLQNSRFACLNTRDKSVIGETKVILY